MVHRMHFDLAKDLGGLAAGFTPLAFLGQLGTPAALLSLVNILVFGALRLYDIRLRARERLQLERLKLELEAAKR